MGSTKDNLKSSDKEVTKMFEGLNPFSKKKTAEKKVVDLSMREITTAMSSKLNELIISKKQDVKNESNRYDYNKKALTHLELASTFFDYVCNYFDVLVDVSPTEDFLQEVKDTRFGKSFRAKPTADSAKTLVELWAELEKRLEAAVAARQSKNPKPETIRVLTYLEVIGTFLDASVTQLKEIDNTPG